MGVFAVNIHLICPFRRTNLIPTLIPYLEKQNSFYYPICSPEDISAFDGINKEWLKPFLYTKQQNHIDHSTICFGKCNQFMDNHSFIDGDYYGFVGDDDAHEDGFFDILKQQTKTIVLCNHYGGDSIPPEGHAHPPGSRIIESLDDMCVNHIGFGMYFGKGSLIKNMRFEDTTSGGDGYFCEAMRKRLNNDDDIVILKDSFYFGNYYQKGRHTTRHGYLKDTWQLPIFL